MPIRAEGSSESSAEGVVLLSILGGCEHLVPWKMLDWGLPFLAGFCDSSPSVPFHMGLPSVAACFIKVCKPEIQQGASSSKTEVAVSCKLIAGVMFYHPCGVSCWSKFQYAHREEVRVTRAVNNRRLRSLGPSQSPKYCSGLNSRLNPGKMMSVLKDIAIETAQTEASREERVG